MKVYVKEIHISFFSELYSQKRLYTNRIKFGITASWIVRSVGISISQFGKLFDIFSWFIYFIRFYHEIESCKRIIEFPFEQSFFTEKLDGGPTNQNRQTVTPKLWILQLLDWYQKLKISNSTSSYTWNRNQEDDHLLVPKMESESINLFCHVNSKADLNVYFETPNELHMAEICT